MKNSSLLSLEAYDSSSSESDKNEERPKTSPLANAKSLMETNPSSFASHNKLVVAGVTTESKGIRIYSGNPAKGRIELNKEMKQKSDKKRKKTDKKMKKSNLEETIENKQLPESDLNQIDCLSSWTIKSIKEENCDKVSTEVADSSDSEMNKTNDSSDEHEKVLHPKSKQSLSQTAKKKKKCKEKRKLPSPREETQNSKENITNPGNGKWQLKKKQTSPRENERLLKKREQEKKIENKSYKMSIESNLKCSSRNKEKGLISSICSSSESSSSEEGQYTSDDDDDCPLQAAKTSCVSEVPRVFNMPVSDIPLPNISTPKGLKRKYSTEPTDISTPISSSNRSSFLTKESLFTSTPSNLSHFSSKSDMSPFLKESHSSTPTSLNWRHSVKENFSSPSISNRYLPLSPAPLKRNHSMIDEDSGDDKLQESIETDRSFDFSGSDSRLLLKGRRSFPDARSLGLLDKFKHRQDADSRRQSLPGNNSHRANQISYSPGDSFYRHKRMRTDLPYYNVSNLMTFKSEEGFIDCHCHIDFLFNKLGYRGTFSSYQKENKDTFPECFKGCLAIFCNPTSFKKKHLWLAILEEKNVWASFGCHPHNSWDYNDDVEESLYSALEHPKVRALGEIGLDYSNRNNCSKDVQHNAFRRQLKIALEKKLPLVIHCREAHTDCMEIMKEMVPKNYSIHLHCFTDTWDIAEKWLQEFPRLYIGLTNLVTFPSASGVHEVAKKIPLTRLLLETDAPYFTPKPLLREHPNTRVSHPGMAIHVAAQIAGLKGGIPLEMVLSMTRQNCRNMYNI